MGLSGGRPVNLWRHTIKPPIKETTTMPSDQEPTKDKTRQPTVRKMSVVLSVGLLLTAPAEGLVDELVPR